jgi:mRNA interferase HigB
MRLVGRKRLEEFQRTHADVRAWVSAWVAEVETAEWGSPKDIKDRYSTASVISDQVIVFNVKGNRYRLEAHVSYAARIVSVIRWGTHAEYDKWTW